MVIFGRILYVTNSISFGDFFPVFYPKRYLNSLLKLKTLKPDSLLLAHDGKIQFSDIDFNYLLQKAPSIPMTHWRSVKSKLKQVFKSSKAY